MKVFPIVLISGSVLASLVSSPGNAKEPEPTVDSVLSKWEEASQKCKTLDAKLTVFSYDAVFDDGHPTITQGRFYYEAPNLGRYEIRKRESGQGRRITGRTFWKPSFGPAKIRSGSTEIDFVVRSFPRRNCGHC